MRNSSPVEWFCAENDRGLSTAPKLRVSLRVSRGLAVGERSMRAEVAPKGAVERMEVIMPARVAIKRVRTPLAESLRFPGEGQSSQG